MKTRRGLSEIVSAFLIIAVVVSGISLYVALSNERILGQTLSVKEFIQTSKSRVQELLVPVEIVRNSTNHDIIDVYVMNNGLKNITITDVIINGTTNIESFSDITNDIDPFFVQDLDWQIIYPNNKTVPQMPSIISLNFTGTEFFPNNEITTIILKTDSNKLIQIVNNTR